MKLLEALSYRDRCPFCFDKLSGHHSQNQVVIYNSKVVIKTIDAEISIDSSSEKIIEITQKSSYSDIYDVGFSGKTIAVRNANSISNFKGDIILGVTIECDSCTMYSYTLSLFLDFVNFEFKSAHLNAEWISLEENKSVFEIRNSYGLGITEYTHFGIDGSTKQINLPLVPLNFLNPKETLERIQNLIIFT